MGYESEKIVVDWLIAVGMKNFVEMEKVFYCLKRKKFCEEENFYNLEEDFYYLLQTWIISWWWYKWEVSGGIYSLQSTKYLTYFNPKSRKLY